METTAIKKRETPAVNLLEAIGIASIAAQIQSGDTFGEIADKAGVSRGSLHAWLDTFHADADRFAREASAEAWLDKGLAALEAAKFKSGDLCPNAAKAISQECARRAAIRNSKYRDRADVAVEVGVSPLSDFLRSIADKGSTVPINSGRIIEHDAEPD